MSPDDHNGSGALPFPDVIDPFIRVCPGPALAVRALRLVAYQPVEGIAGLEPDSNGDGPGNTGNGRKPTHLHRLGDVAGKRERAGRRLRAGWDSRTLPGAGSLGI